MRSINKILTITLSIIFTISCSDETDVDFNSDYFPLHVGNIWYYDSLSADISPWRIRKISDSIVINGTVYYIFQAGEGVDIIDTIRADEAGNIWNRSNNRDYLWFDFSLDSGATYVFDVPKILGGIIHYYNFEVNKYFTKETPADTFDNCIEFYSYLPSVMDAERFYTFAPNVGLIIHGSGWSGNILHMAIINGDTIK